MGAYCKMYITKHIAHNFNALQVYLETFNFIIDHKSVIHYFLPKIDHPSVLCANAVNIVSDCFSNILLPPPIHKQITNAAFPGLYVSCRTCKKLKNKVPILCCCFSLKERNNRLRECLLFQQIPSLHMYCLVYCVLMIMSPQMTEGRAQYLWYWVCATVLGSLHYHNLD